MNQELLRKLPKVDVLLQDERVIQAAKRWGRTSVTEALRSAVDRCRQDVLAGILNLPPDPETIIQEALEDLDRKPLSSLRPVINGTGVVLHTNLGRAPLSRRALQAVTETAAGYSNLEYCLESGERGSRHDHIVEILKELLGTEDAMVVNNNAAAVLLALSALAKDREVLVSRGELIEIGGSFRIPDICSLSGAVLREVGTTNRTRIRDYQNALGEETGAILKAHTSNYRIVGFTEDASLEDLEALAQERDIPLIYDMGSGLFEGLEQYGIDEPSLSDVIKKGVDVVTFSGDKLLGRAQAGLIVGKKQYIEKMKRHPLARALRVDKMTLAAMAATLQEYRDKTQDFREIPVLRMISADPLELKERAERLCRKLREAGTHPVSESPSKTAELPRDKEKDPGGLLFAVEPCQDKTGGGSAPLSVLEGYAVTVQLPDSVTAEQEAAFRTLQDLETALRRAKNPLVTRIGQDRIWISVRTLLEQEEEKIVEDFKEILSCR